MSSQKGAVARAWRKGLEAAVASDGEAVRKQKRIKQLIHYSFPTFSSSSFIKLLQGEQMSQEMYICFSKRHLYFFFLFENQRLHLSIFLCASPNHTGEME
jgi:hypothetical protein